MEHREIVSKCERCAARNRGELHKKAQIISNRFDTILRALARRGRHPILDDYYAERGLVREDGVKISPEHRLVQRDIVQESGIAAR